MSSERAASCRGCAPRHRPGDHRSGRLVGVGIALLALTIGLSEDWSSGPSRRHGLPQPVATPARPAAVGDAQAQAVSIDGLTVIDPFTVDPHAANRNAVDPDARGAFPLGRQPLEFRRQQVEALTDLSTPDAWGQLMSASRDPDPDVRQLALQGLALAADEASLRAIVAALADADSQVVQAAIDALAVRAEPDTALTLAGVLHHVQPETRLRAVHALADIGGHDAGQLLRLAAADSDPRVRDSANAALAEFALD